MQGLQLFEVIERVNKIPGWFYENQMTFLYPYAQKAENILEIGTYAGKSTLFWALCNPDARIITTDTCIGVPANGITGLSILPQVVAQGQIVALKENSHELAKRFNQPIDLLFIDGGHEYAAVCQDITDWLPKVKGIIVMHDYMDAWPGIKQAVDNCLRGKVEIISTENDLFIAKSI